jgi:hypothetical protein
MDSANIFMVTMFEMVLQIRKDILHAPKTFINRHGYCPKILQMLQPNEEITLL